jgi:ubiquinone/menaquinone biosynthesis C-methylase UbiE
MPEMSKVAQLACRSAPWRLFAARVVLPWALQGSELRGDVLEIGCGSGAMAAAVLRRHPHVRLTATDFDRSMVDVAKDRLAAFGSRADVRQADATQLPFADRSFDAVLTFVMLHHVLEWEQAFAEMARVLKPGGRILGYDLLGDGPGRVIGGHEKGTRLMRQHELRHVLGELPFATAAVSPAFGRLTVRFNAQKVEHRATG